MFRLWELHRACQMHSFLFNPLAARPVQYGRGTAMAYLLSWTEHSSLSSYAGSSWCPGKAGGREASCPQLWRSFILLAWVNRFAHHQCKHRCWCYQWLLLVCLFICIKPVTRKPQQAWEHSDQRVVQEPTAIVLTEFAAEHFSIACRDMNLPHPLHAHTVTSSAALEWYLATLRLHTHNETPVLKPTEAWADSGPAAQPVLHSCKGLRGAPLRQVWAPHTAHQNVGQGAESVEHQIRLYDHPYQRCFIIKPKPFCNTTRFSHRW